MEATSAGSLEMTSHTCLDCAHKPVQISKQMASTSGHCLPGGNISSLPSSSWETEVQRDARLSPVRRSPCFRGDHSDIIQATIYSWFVRSAQYLKGISLLPRQTASSPGGAHTSWAVNFHLILRDVCDMSPALPLPHEYLELPNHQSRDIICSEILVYAYG